MNKKQYETKKFLVLNYIQLGMDIDRAYILAELTQQEIESFEKDTTFQKEVDTTTAILEKNLLERHKDAIEIAILKGNSKPIEWMLGKISPEKWGDKKEDIPIRGTLIISKEDEKLL